MKNKNILKNKKSFLKTLEVFLAITIVFIFMFITQDGNMINNNNDIIYDVVGFLSNDVQFRNDIYSIENDCVEKGSSHNITTKIESILPKYLDYTICVYDDPNFRITTLPDKKITVDSYYFSTDEFSYNPRLARLFYWS